MNLPVSSRRFLRRTLAATAATAALAVTAACGSAGTGVDAASRTPDGIDCKPYAAWMGHAGTTVNYMHSAGNNVVAIPQIMQNFMDCTGITVKMDGHADFEGDLTKAVESGHAPDMATIYQPGLIKKFAESGAAKPLPPALAAKASSLWSKEFIGYGSDKDKQYGIPLTADVKSLVWYSPKEFAKNGWQVPATFGDMRNLTEKIAASGKAPWCAGFESGGNTGWPGTDWIEDFLLRTQPLDVYDGWVAHTVPFADPRIQSTFDLVGSYLKDDKLVHEAAGKIGTTPFQTSGLGVVEGKCSLYRMADFYGGMWPKGANVAPDGDVWAFYLPAVDPATVKPVLVAGEFEVAFSQRPEVQAVQEFTASQEYAVNRYKFGGSISPNNLAPMSLYAKPFDKLQAQILHDPKAVVRFDGSDMMPSSVGAGTFWQQIVKWVEGQSTADTTKAIDASWPKG